MFGSKRKSLTFAWGVTVLMLLTINLSGIIYYNGAEKGSDDPPPGTSSIQSCDSLRCYIIEGAGYFLQAHADFMAFLRGVELAELQGTDLNVLAAKLDSGVAALQAAQDIYLRLKQKADAIPYNWEVIDRLSIFDYEAFGAEKKLNKTIFDGVKSFLRRGEIREMYANILVQHDEIMAVAGIIRGELKSGQFPELDHLYQLTETSSRSLLFGQYAARVFQVIK